MRIAIIGSHGTGKTTIINYLKREFSDFYYYGDVFRDLTNKLKYSTPREVAQESGITAFVSAALNEYCNLKKHKKVIFDQGPIVMMGYYYVYINKLGENANKFVEKLAKYYADMVDFHIYIPVGKIPLISDEMRPTELDFQYEVDEMIRYSIKKLGIDNSRIYEVQSIGIQDRVKEVIEVIRGLMKNGK